MSQRLPPLNALKAFEAAARHLSVKKAAVELNVTPAAVSHQIRTLEEYLDVQLFHRYNRALELTSAAHDYATPGRKQIAIKVIDIFGNDTTKVIGVDV